MTAGPAGNAAYNLRNARVFVAGHRGMVGSAICRRLEQENCEVLTAGRDTMDLRDQAAVRAWFNRERPDTVVLAAAKVGGIMANATYPVDFLYDNLALETNVIEAAFRNGVGRLLFLGSSCIYPVHAPQPMAEDALLTGPLEKTNEWYAIAKIAGLKLCAAYRRQYGVDYISGMPTNLYGPGDNFDLEKSHVIPALMRKAHDAKLSGAPSMTIWGSGTPLREFLHVDDCADACVHLLKTYSSDTHVNIGCGQEITIRALTELVAKAVGYQGQVVPDPSKPDGAPRKLLDVSRLLATGWQPRIELEDGLKSTYVWFQQHLKLGDARLNVA